MNKDGSLHASTRHDWPGIEAEWRSGQLSGPDIARLYSVPLRSIYLKAREEGWTRDMTGGVRREIDRMLAQADARTMAERQQVPPPSAWPALPPPGKPRQKRKGATPPAAAAQSARPAPELRIDPSPPPPPPEEPPESPAWPETIKPPVPGREMMPPGVPLSDEQVVDLAARRAVEVIFSHRKQVARLQRLADALQTKLEDLLDKVTTIDKCETASRVLNALSQAVERCQKAERLAFNIDGGEREQAPAHDRETLEAELSRLGVLARDVVAVQVGANDDRGAAA